MPRSSTLAIAAGALICALMAMAVARASANNLAQGLGAQAQATIARAGGTGVRARFTTAHGWASRHPQLMAGANLADPQRARTARAVAAIPGVGAVKWADGTRRATTMEDIPRPLHCQRNVEALLRTRTIRFAESSARIDPTSRALIDEVVTALRPCLGSLIAITGHTDSSGPEPGNLALSQERANAVRAALVARGIPADGLRALGVGSSTPVPGLEPTDPANRRIEFSVIAIVPIRPTPVDEPGPR